MVIALIYTQENRMVRIATPLGGEKLLIAKFQGVEKISDLFHFNLSLLSTNHGIDFKSIIGGNVTVAIRLINGEERFINGIISTFSQIGGDVRDEQSGMVFFPYTATMVPWLWLLSQTSDLRIFQEKSVIDIIEQIFSEKGFVDYKKKLSGTYLPRTYCVQYRETDFNFISRLMEEEGIAYYFIHENGRHTLVLADAAGSYTPCPHYEKIRCHQASCGKGGFLDEDVITTLALRNEIRPAKYTLKDYNFKTPNNKLLVEMDGIENLGPGEKEFYDYPGLYTKLGDGEALANARIQREEARIATITGTSDVRGLASGYSFTLKEYFREELNEKKYLLTSVKHSVEQEAYRSGAGENSYSNTFSCIPLDTPFRPSRSTPKPIVEGVQTAIVVGPAGEEIHTDEHGRIKVQFHWDREGKADEDSSCWIRVGQTWSGSGWGAMFIPRIGHEVIVDFLEGDPDRPIVIGSVYHGANRPPYNLPAEKTKSTIKSNSSKGGGGFNEIRLEDKAGSEEIFIHGQKDWNINILNNKGQTIGVDETMSVGNNRTKSVGNDQSESIGKNKTIMVGSNHTETIAANMAVTVGANRTLTIASSESKSVGASSSETVANNKSSTVGSSSAETVALAKALSIGGAYQISVGAAMNETVIGMKAEEVGITKTVAVGGNLSETVGKSHSLKAKNVLIEADSDITFKSGAASIVLKSDGTITLKGVKISQN